MKRVAAILMFALLQALPTTVFAQTETPADAARRKLEEPTDAERMKNLDALLNTLNAPPKPDRSSATPESIELNDKLVKFQLAVPKFHEAVDQYRAAMGVKGKLAKPLKNIEKQADLMLSYLEAAKFVHPKPDPMEFKGYSPVELQWETLNSAERIASFIDLAVIAQRASTLELKTIEFLFKVDGELLRLKWLTSHTK